jgi:hypothetical protein
VAVEQRADDAAVEHAGERVVVWLGREVGDHLVALDEALDAEAALVGGTAAEAEALGRVLVLEALALLWGRAVRHAKASSMRIFCS